MDNTVEFLRQVDIFSLLSSSEIHNILNSLHFTEIEKGKTIFKEGDEGKTLFIVKSGKISISIRLSDGKEREITEFSSGDFFGEMSIFENAPRSATCHTKEKSILLSLHESDFFKLIKDHSYIAIKIMYRMLTITSQRLRDTSEFLSDMVVWGEKATKRAVTDELTGVYNRRFLDGALENYFVTSKNKSKPLSLIMVDLDYFREINERYGNKTGDHVILAVVDVFKKYLRQHDIIARYGGDEFTVLLPDTGIDDVRGIAENICKEVRVLDLLKGFECPINKVTISQGIASFPEHADNIKTLLEKADQALYRAKKEGRNRVSIAD